MDCISLFKYCHYSCEEESYTILQENLHLDCLVPAYLKKKTILPVNLRPNINKSVQSNSQGNPECVKRNQMQ